MKPPFSISFISCSLLRPILWHPPHPFFPSISAIGCIWAIGKAFMAAHARACFPCLNWATRFGWHLTQVSGVGICTCATSAADLCRSPWHAAQPILFLPCLLSRQSETMTGFNFLWQLTQTSAIAVAAENKQKKLRTNCRSFIHVPPFSFVIWQPIWATARLYHPLYSR